MGQNLSEGEALAPGDLDHCVGGGEKSEQAGSCLDHPKTDVSSQSSEGKY